MAPGAWGSGLTLAQRMRAAAPVPTEPTPTPTAPVKTPFVPIQPPSLSPHDWYHHNPCDGSIHPPSITSLDTHTLAISILILHNQQILMLRDWDEDEKDEKQGVQLKWKIPNGTLQCNENIIQAVTRVLSSHLPSSMLSSFTATHYVTLEHYPSLKQQWMRVAVTGTMTQPELVSEQDAFHWHPVDDLSAHLSYNDHQLLDAHGSGRTIPITYTTTTSTSTSTSPSTSPYFPYHLLELAILHDHKVLLIKYKHDTHEWWSLPQTHVDRGEHLGFTSIRLARALFGICLESVDGIISINTQARTDVACEGGRFTTFVDMAKQPDKTKDGNTTATNAKQQAIDEAVKAAAAAAATDAATSLSSAAAQLSLTSSTPISSTPVSASSSAPSTSASTSTSTSTSTHRSLPIDPDFNASSAPPHEWFTLDQLRDLDTQHLLRADLLAMLTPVLQDNTTGVPLIHV